MGRLIDLTGTVHGKWTVICRADNSKHQQTRWHCVCECGNQRTVQSSDLRSGKSICCGCSRKHHLSHTPEWLSWRAMMQRCNYKDHKYFSLYGGRGITICERWATSFLAFLDDMGPRPTSKHTLDRINSNGNYCPANCRWVTRKQQCRNRRNNKTIAFNGMVLCISEWSEMTGLHKDTINKRLRAGWSVEDVLTKPLRARHVQPIG